jgi:hypothetical protein
LTVSENGSWSFYTPNSVPNAIYPCTGANCIIVQNGVLVANPAVLGTVSHPNIIDNNGFSTAAAPDYTYWDSSGEGMYHPASSQIGLAVGGVSGLLVTNNSLGTITDTVPNLIDTAVATSPSTAPICPNGAAGAFTTVGCAGSGGTGTICSGTISIPASAIASAAKSAFTGTCTGAATTDNIMVDFAGGTDPTTLVGFQPSTSGILTILKWATANTANVTIENNTANSITPTAFTLNYRITR